MISKGKNWFCTFIPKIIHPGVLQKPAILGIITINSYPLDIISSGVSKDSEKLPNKLFKKNTVSLSLEYQTPIYLFSRHMNPGAEKSFLDGSLKAF
jgi:hypothetical protein